MDTCGISTPPALPIATRSNPHARTPVGSFLKILLTVFTVIFTVIDMALLTESLRGEEFTVRQLVSLTGQLLHQVGLTVRDDRVSNTPDVRMVRYYQSIALVDRPHRYEGRTALYGFRHLLQVLAIKLLQSRGYSLARIQQALTGLPTPRLEAAILQSLSNTSSPPAASPAAAPVPAPRAAAPSSPKTLVAMEVAPGITVTIDPAKVADPQRLMARFQSIALTLPGDLK